MIKERIIQQATSLFIRDGIKNVSMDYLASSLGISKRTIYMNFKDKEDILKQCMLISQEKIKHNIHILIDQSENIIDGCLQIIEEYKNIQLPTARFWDDIYKYYPLIYQSFLDEIGKNNTCLKELLEKGIQDNYFRENLNIDETLNYYVIISNIYSLRISFSRTDLISNIMVNMLRGISTYKGIEIIDKYIDNIAHSNN